MFTELITGSNTGTKVVPYSCAAMMTARPPHAVTVRLRSQMVTVLVWTAEVTRGLQTTSQDIPVHPFISEHFSLTYFLTFSVDLAIANVI